jgi:hypothetical protein
MLVLADATHRIAHLFSVSAQLRNVYRLSAELRNSGVSETDRWVVMFSTVKRHEIYVTGLWGRCLISRIACLNNAVCL